MYTLMMGRNKNKTVIATKVIACETMGDSAHTRIDWAETHPHTHNKTTDTTTYNGDVYIQQLLSCRTCWMEIEREREREREREGGREGGEGGAGGITE